MRIPRVFQRLLAELMCGQVIGLQVCGGCGAMRVFCQVVKFCNTVVRTLGHSVLLRSSMQSKRGGSATDARTKCKGSILNAKSQ
jgi:hypothetical protein